MGCGDGRLSAEIAKKFPEKLREGFVSEMVKRYIKSHPSDEEGHVHVRMVRLEIEAHWGGFR